MAFQHTSVLLEETIDGLAVKPDGIYVDATLGGGGHAFEVCSRLNGNGRFIGIDPVSYTHLCPFAYFTAAFGCTGFPCPKNRSYHTRKI